LAVGRWPFFSPCGEGSWPFAVGNLQLAVFFRLVAKVIGSFRLAVFRLAAKVVDSWWLAVGFLPLPCYIRINTLVHRSKP
jgi:hypothetical protein